MKTAEEWYQLRKRKIDSGECDRRPSREFYQAIQLDALKEAAEIACDSQKYYTRSASIQCLQIRDAILNRVRELESSPEKEGE